MAFEFRFGEELVYAAVAGAAQEHGAVQILTSEPAAALFGFEDLAVPGAGYEVVARQPLHLPATKLATPTSSIRITHVASISSGF